MMLNDVNFCSLPHDCISTILSLTTPHDMCRLSLISSLVRTAADCDIAWERFLPTDYQDILSDEVAPPVQFSSKKELYFRLCDSVLLNGGRKKFWLERSTGRKCYMLGARELSIPWGNDSMYWSWKPIPQSRFSEAIELIELRTICWLEIQGKINARILSPNTKYAAYLVLKIADRAYGLDSIPSETSVEVGNHVSRGTVYIRSEDSHKKMLQHLYFGNRTQVLKSRVSEGDERVLCDRQDGWMEIELGEFFISNGNEGDIKMNLMEVKGEHLKGGLIVEGIEVRPKKRRQ